MVLVGQSAIMASSRGMSLGSEDIKQLLHNGDEGDVTECFSGNEDENNELSKSGSKVEVTMPIKYTKCGVMWNKNFTSS
jgi:hypothetical protein